MFAGVPHQRILIVIFFILTLLLSGCTSNNSDSAVDVDQSVHRVNMAGAIAVLNDSDVGLGMSKKPYTIHNIIGRDINSEGMAATWILSVNSDDQFYFILDNGTISTMRWEEEKKDNIVDFNRIITPDKLFLRNDRLIANLTENGKTTVDEIEYRNGWYFLRGNKAGDMWERAFDATTGKQLY
jgi:hypothetical protein